MLRLKQRERLACEKPGEYELKGLMQLFNEVWSQVLEQLAKNLADSLVYVAMIVLFAVGLLKCIYPVIKSRGQLRRGIRKIKSEESKDAWQDKRFLGKGPLTAPWTEFLNSRLFADDEYHNASPLDDYINEDTAIYDPGFASFGDAVPGMLVSLGFLGTLIGIIMGLSDFNLDSSGATMDAIRVLMNGMRYAFSTSIVGVVLSVTFSLLVRLTQGSTRKALKRFYDAMQQQAHMVTVDPITQITIYQQEQTAMIHELAKDITGSMTDRIGAAIEMALQPLQQSLDNFITVSSREQVRGVDAIVNKFVDNMDAALNGRFQQLSDTIAETCRWHKDTQEMVEATINGLNRVSRDIVQIQQMSESLVVKFDGYISRLGAAQQSVEDGFGAAADNVKSMEMVARQQANYIAQIGQMQTDFMREVNSFQTRMDAFTKAYVENTNISTNALHKVSEELKASGEDLLAAHKAFSKSVNGDLQHAFGMFDANMQDIIDKLTGLINAISDSVKDMPAIMNDTANAYADQMRQLTRTIEHAQRLLDETARRSGRGGGQ